MGAFALTRRVGAALLLALVCVAFLGGGRAWADEKEDALKACDTPGVPKAAVEACEEKVREAWNQKGEGGDDDKATCDMYVGQAKRYCEEHSGESSGGGDDGGSAFSNLSPDCKSAPVAAQPGRGSGSWFQGGGPEKPTAPYAPDQDKYLAHLYERDGLAGMDWHTYDLDCKSPTAAFSVMDQSIDNKFGSWLLGAARWWSSLAAELHKHAASDSYVKEFTGAAADVIGDLTDGIYKPWLPISVSIVGLTIIFGAVKADWAGTMKRIVWGLGVLVLTAITIQYPQTSAQVADDALVSVTSRIQQSMAGDPDDSRAEAGMAAGNLNAHTTLYDGWARGMFGDSESPVAKKYGPVLYDAQSLSWWDAKLPPKERERVIEDKAKRWEKAAAAVKKADPDAYEYLTGRKSARGAAGFEIAFSAIPSNTMQIAAGTILAAAREILVLVVVFMPVIGLLAIHKALSGTLRSIAKGAGAAMINAPMFALGSGVFMLAQRHLLNEDGIPSWLGVILLWVLFIMIWAMLKPFRSLNSMVSPSHDWFGSGVGVLGRAKGAATKGVMAYAGKKLMARQLGRILGDGGKGAAKRGDGPEDAEAGSGTMPDMPEPTPTAPTSGPEPEGTLPWWQPTQETDGGTQDIYTPGSEIAVPPNRQPATPVGADVAGAGAGQESGQYDVPGPRSAPASGAASSSGASAGGPTYVAGPEGPAPWAGVPHQPGPEASSDVPPPTADRPAPFVAPSVREEDGTTTYTIYSPAVASGYETRRDDLSDHLRSAGDE